MVIISHIAILSHSKSSQGKSLYRNSPNHVILKTGVSDISANISVYNLHIPPTHWNTHQTCSWSLTHTNTHTCSESPVCSGSAATPPTVSAAPPVCVCKTPPEHTASYSPAADARPYPWHTHTHRKHLHIHVRLIILCLCVINVVFWNY